MQLEKAESTKASLELALQQNELKGKVDLEMRSQLETDLAECRSNNEFLQQQVKDLWNTGSSALEEKKNLTEEIANHKAATAMVERQLQEELKKVAVLENIKVALLEDIKQIKQDNQQQLEVASDEGAFKCK